MCELVVLLIYVLCIKKWPEHRWKLSLVGYDPNTIYDFLWQYVSNENPSAFKDRNMMKFDHPYECLATHLEHINRRLSIEQKLK